MAIAAQSQHVTEVKFIFLQSPENTVQVLPAEVVSIDSQKLHLLIDQRLRLLYNLGYLSATYEAQSSDSLSISITFYTGDIFSWIQLRQGNVSDEIMNEVGFRPLMFKNKPVSQGQLVKLLNGILDFAENHGYPFASVKLDSLTFHENGLSAQLNYSSGPQIVFDSLIVRGYNKVKPKYLMTHLGIYRGKPYQENLISEIPNKIKLLSFVSLSEEPEIRIANGKCSILLSLKPERVSQIDGIVGVLPNQTADEQLLITGQVLLDLHNLFNSGKRVSFQWQSFDAQSQFLDMMYYHPNLFQTPINIEGKFNLLKQDTAFLNRSLALKLSLITKSSRQLGFITDFFSSRIIGNFGLEELTQLPENNDFNLNYYGISYQHIDLDDVRNPTRGQTYSLSGSAGQKKILKNPAISDSLYNEVALNSLQLRFDGALDKYWPINNYLIIRTRLLGGYLQAENLFIGDLYRIGGLNSLRGFAEKSIFASSYGIANLELRAYLSPDTYLMLFFDQAFIDNEAQEDSPQEYPFGAGTGLSLSTQSGIFSFAFAMGKSANQPFTVSHAKIHFGYIARF